MSDNKTYLNTVVSPIIEELVLDLLRSKPDDVRNYMIQWLQKKKSEQPEDPITDEIKPTKKQELEENEYDSDSKPQKYVKKANAYGEMSESDEDDEGHEEEEEFVSEFSDVKKKLKEKGFRTSVSAEAYGIFNKKSQFEPKLVHKSETQKHRIRERIGNSFMFQSLDAKDLDIVIGAFQEQSFKAGETVIKQGDDGEHLYVIDKGVLDCYRRINQEERHLKIYEPGEAFGELALLYNAPRAATIICKTDVILFALDRECFNHIVKDAAMKKREKYEDFLSKIELLDQMDPYERMKIADALKVETFNVGESVVREGERGNTFYFVEEGEAMAIKMMNGVETQVYQYKCGDYFGELALLKDTPRQASIIAKTDLKVVALDRYSFKRLLGPLEDILKRNFSKYEKFIY